MKGQVEKHTREATVKLVSAALLKRGLWVSTRPQDTKSFHILCMNADATKRVGIRVAKSNTTSRIWTLNEKVKEYPDNLFYVFVGYKNAKSPELFVVPVNTVLDFTEQDAQRWLSTKRRDGGPHKNIRTRKFVIKSSEKKKYLNRWDVLGLG